MTFLLSWTVLKIQLCLVLRIHPVYYKIINFEKRNDSCYMKINILEVAQENNIMRVKFCYEEDIAKQY